MRQAQGAAIGCVGCFGDARQRTRAEPRKQGRPIEWWAIREAQCQGSPGDVTAATSGMAELAWRDSEDLANGVVELADTRESRGERDVREGEVGSLDQCPRGLRSLRPGDRERTGAQLAQHQAMEMTLADRKAFCHTGDAIAIDDPVCNQAHRAANEIAPDVPFR